MEAKLAFTHFLNHVFGGITTQVLLAVGYHPAIPGTPYDDTFAVELAVTLLLITFFLLVRLTLSVEKPNPAQQIAEMIHEFSTDQCDQVIGHGYQRFQAFVTCVGLFILLNNFAGLLYPTLDTPTSHVAVPLGVAMLTFIYYNFHGLREQGPIGYIKHFAGPVWWMSWLLFPVEVVSHLARMMSLTVRLYANMLASDLLTIISFSIIPIAVPAVLLGLHFAVSIIQAYVFMLLSMIYIAMAVAHEH
ncbi:MAG TPA: F0F1 ATP synthase subunit A [Terracidiphilus sp.]|nr:F0F1 ATP synthase subunit A [Terracidiphilus sp.]